MPPPAPGPLAGVLVADLSTVLAGPFATMLLADLGADVVKVEPPEGDATRGWGPPFVGAGLDGPADPGTAAYYLAVNRNKRSLRLDLKRPEGAAVLRRLLEQADLLVENFRVGGLDRLGFDDAELARRNPRLVHLAITGYGPDGPDAAKPGYDFVLQAVAGLMSITGFPDEAGGRPTKVGVAISDVVTGMFGAIGALAALGGRERQASPAAGRGQRVDVSILESTLAVLINQAQNAFVGGAPPGRLGNAHPNLVPYETFATADGQLALGVGSERQWRRLSALLELDGLAADPRFATNAGRVEHRAGLRPLLAASFVQRRTAEWLDALDGAGIPAGPVNDALAAIESPQARVRGMDATVDHPALGRIRQVGLPFELSATPATIRSAPPLLGEQADEILAELGYAAAEVAALRAAGVI
jgi:crotonobetainyl-CoA:carnitine CoA-transferase CaiB-like acyl-CoA transferase